MTDLAPPIYVRLGVPPQVGLAGRMLALAIAGMALGVMLVAAWLHPAPGGVSTHTQLGFAPCQFLDRTGIPCAGCGMTTSFTWFAHGHPIKSFIAQPFGFVLAIATCSAFWISAYIAFTGKAAYRLLRMIKMQWHFYFWIPLAAFGWVWKIIAIVGSH